MMPKSRDIETNAQPGNYQIALWAMIVVLAIILSLRNYLSFQIGVYTDDSEYAVLAQSFAHSDTYGLINLSGQPMATRYPFGYPLLIAPFAKFFPADLDALKLPSLIATILNAGLLFWGWRWLSGGLSYWWGLAISGLYMLSPLTIGHTRMVMSEPVFMTFCLTAIILTERARGKPQGLLGLFLMSLSLLFAVFTRTIGLILVIVMAVFLLFTRGRNAWKEILAVMAGMIVLLGIIIAVTPLTFRNVLPSAYANQFTSPSSWGQNSQEDAIGTRVVIAAQEYLMQHIRQTVLPIGGGDGEQAFASRIGLPFLPALFGLALTGMIVLGCVRWISMTGLPVSLLFSAIYLCVLVLWPWRGPRFLYPLQPQLYLGLLLGGATLLTPILRRLRRDSLIYVGLMMVAVLGLTTLSIYKDLRLDDSRNHTGDLEMRSHWLRDNSETSAVVMTEEPQTDYLYSGRKTIPYRGFQSPDEFENYLIRHNVEYILLAPQLQWQAEYSPAYNLRTKKLLSMLETLASDGRATLVYDSERDLVKIYRVPARR